MILNNPKLWWPHGHGDQFLYTVKIIVQQNMNIIGSSKKRIGVRKVEIDQSLHPVEGQYFIIRINDRPIFLKGGNWVPPDMIYSSVTHEKLAKLVDLAVTANFNMLRIWGGGTWAGHDLLELCDEKGLIVWHDFLFACAKYPGDNPEFLAEIRKEVTWAVREFAHHPSLAVWCGNNELEWGTFSWGYDKSGRSLPDYALYHHVIPVILRAENPQIPYWPSSPFSPDHGYPNSPTSGDQHPWGVSIGGDGPNFWAYRQYVDRFPNEGGVMGMSSPATLRQFMPDDEIYKRSFTWEHHENTANLWADELGINYQIVEYWLGLPYNQMDFDTYAFASALLQAEGLTEYISNFRRRMFSTSSAIFWMYNDSWPVTHGWTIVDYYLRKKLAYHPVRRVFNSLSVVIAEAGDKIHVYGVNDTPLAWQGLLRFGFFGIQGGLPLDNLRSVSLPANQSVIIASLSRKKWEDLRFDEHGSFAVLLNQQGQPINQYKLFLTRFKDLKFKKPKVRLLRKGDYLELESSTFVWGLCLDLNGESEMSDNCFDIFPGIPYRLKWPRQMDLPEVVMTGNDLLK